MKKRLISMVLAVSMAVSVVPAPVLAANIGGGGKNSADPDPVEVQTQDSLGGLFQPPSTSQTLTKDTIYIGTSSTTTVSTEEQLKNAISAATANSEISIKLTGDIDLTSTLTISANATIDLDLGGHTLKASDSFAGTSLIKVNGTLTVTNGTLDGNNKTMCVYVWVSGSFTLDAGATIQNGNGGGVWNSGSFTMMDGSKIMNCTATAGGAVYNYANSNNATFTMNGGEITDCTSNEGQSDAVYSSQSMSPKSIFNANGGTVNGTVKNNNNSCTITVETGKSGTTFNGTVYNYGTISGGTFYAGIQGDGTVDYAKITLGVSPEELQTKLSNAQSGDVLNLKLKTDGELASTLKMNSNATINLDLGGHTLKASDTFDSNTNYWGLIYIGNGSLTLTNGTLDSDNKTRCVCVWSDTGSFTLGAGATIQNGKSDAGAGVLVNKGTFTMKSGSQIMNCYASNWGGAVGLVSWPSNEFKMEDGTIDNCTASRGGAVSNAATFTMTGGTIRNCKSTGQSGMSDAVENRSTFNANGGSISGTVYNSEYGGTLTSTGTTFTSTVYNAGEIKSGSFKDIVSLGGTLDAGVQYSGGLTFAACDTEQLQKVINDAGNTSRTIEVLDDFRIYSPLTIPAGADITLNMNGHTLESSLKTGTAITVGDDSGSAKLTLNNGKLVSSGNRVDRYARAFMVNAGSTLNLNGVTVENFRVSEGEEGAAIYNNGTVNADANTNVGGTVYNAAGASMGGGNFTGAVTNYGTITSGTYTGTVTNENTGVISGGDFSKGKLINNGGTIPSNPDDTKKDDDKPENPVTTYALTVKNAEVTIEDAGKTVETTKNEDGTLTAKVPEGAKVTVKYTAPTDAIVFDLWSITSDAELDVNVKENPLTFTMPDKAVTVEAMTRDATIEDDGPGILGTAAMIGVGVAGTAVLGYQGYMIGTELYLNSVLPAGAAIPQNYGELAKLVWNDAGRPEPIALLAADATDEQKALTWAVENQLIPADKAADASVTRWEVIRAWNQEQEMKKV